LTAIGRLVWNRPLPCYVVFRLARACDPGLFVTGLGQDTTALDGEPRWTAFDDDKHSLGGDTGDPGDCSGDFGGKTGGFCFRMSGPYPAADKHRARRDAVGVNTVGRQLVKSDVHIGAGHVIDRRMDACHFASQRRLDVGAEGRFSDRAGVDRNACSFWAMAEYFGRVCIRALATARLPQLSRGPPIPSMYRVTTFNADRCARSQLPLRSRVHADHGGSSN
jgi:hypothetical protein